MYHTVLIGKSYLGEEWANGIDGDHLFIFLDLPPIREKLDLRILRSVIGLVFGMAQWRNYQSRDLI